MTPKTLRIAIIGCGTAGPAAAVLLSRLGHEVVLCERRVLGVIGEILTTCPTLREPDLNRRTTSARGAISARTIAFPGGHARR